MAYSPISYYLLGNSSKITPAALLGQPYFKLAVTYSALRVVQQGLRVSGHGSHQLKGGGGLSLTARHVNSMNTGGPPGSQAR